jgi:hypothetical protein
MEGGGGEADAGGTGGAALAADEDGERALAARVGGVGNA